MAASLRGPAVILSRILEKACCRATKVMIEENPSDASREPARTSLMVKFGKFSYWFRRTAHNRRLAMRNVQEKREETSIDCSS